MPRAIPPVRVAATTLVVAGNFGGHVRGHGGGSQDEVPRGIKGLRNKGDPIEELRVTPLRGALRGALREGSWNAARPALWPKPIGALHMAAVRAPRRASPGVLMARARSWARPGGPVGPSVGGRAGGLDVPPWAVGLQGRLR